MCDESCICFCRSSNIPRAKSSDYSNNNSGRHSANTGSYRVEHQLNVEESVIPAGNGSDGRGRGGRDDRDESPERYDQDQRYNRRPVSSTTSNTRRDRARY